MSVTIVTLLMIGCIIAYTFQSFFGKLYSINYTGNPLAATPVFSTLYGLIVGISTLVIGSGLQFGASQITWTMGLINAFVLFIYNLSLVNASRTGPYTLQNLMAYSGSVLMSLAFSTLYWGETLSVYQFIGVGVMILSFALINLQNTAFVVHKKSYYLWISLLFLSNGTYCIFLDTQQKLMQQTQRNEMIIITFLGSAVISLIYLLCTQKKASLQAFKMGKKPFIFALISSISAALAIYMLMLLLSRMNAPILLTVQNGCILSLIILLGHIVLHEKITKRMIAGIALCVVSLLLLAI